MAAHLRLLDRCRVCRKPATEELRTTRNELVAVYCTRCAARALREWIRTHPEQG